jgi:nitrite reductase/ring-hydroxylating ferredoxin subunit
MDATPMNSAMTPDVPACAALCEALEAKRGGVSRRTFVSAATLATVAAMLEACGASGGATGPGGSGGAFTVTLASFSQLSTVGGIARVDGGTGSPTALVRTGTSSFVALSMICTHEGTTIGISGSGFTCPNHGAKFDSTGAWVSSPQRTTNLTSFTTTFDSAAGTVRINRP